MSFCPQCGHSNPDGSKWCGHCGFHLAGTAGGPERKPGDLPTEGSGATEQREKKSKLHGSAEGKDHRPVSGDHGSGSAKKQSKRKGGVGSAANRPVPLSFPPTPPKPKWPWFAAIGAILIMAAVIGVVKGLPEKVRSETAVYTKDGGNHKKEPSEKAYSEEDDILGEILALVEEMEEEEIPADEYYEVHSEVVESFSASQSPDVLTEAEAVALLRDRGFTQDPVTYKYAINGDLYEETEALENTSDRHPMYQTSFFSASGELWVISIVNGELFANPVSFNLASGSGVQVLLSESGALTSYDNTTNQFFVTIPDKTEVTVKVVERIDAAALDDLTAEEIAAL